MTPRFRHTARYAPEAVAGARGRRISLPHRMPWLPALAAVITLGSVTVACDVLDPDHRRRLIVADSGPKLAVDWSELAYDIAYAEDQFLTFKGHRAIATMHLAMHDALQAIAPVYASHAFEADAPDADPLAAAATAAHDVLLAAYPDRQATLDSALTAWLERARDPASAETGKDLGSDAALALMELRADDGWFADAEYAFTSGPGQYQTTPPWEGFVLLPAFGVATPFSFDDPARFRPPAPPALDSPEYAAALDEVRLYGDSTSTVRTADETGYAIWWMEFSESAVGRVVRRMLRERELDLWQTNRVLAHLYMSLADAYVTTWESKYGFNHWRPYTAIRAADTDGNDATVRDPDWVPLRPTPPFPEYVSAHAAGCGAAYDVMAATFGDDVAFENTSLTAPDAMPTRSFASFSAAAEECADSRIHLGWHYRYATDAGLVLGRSVASHVVTTTLAPR